MSVDKARELSLRPGRFELSRLAWALILSLALHGGGYGTYKAGKQLGLWQAMHLPAWLQKSKLFALIPKPPKNEPVKPEEIPMVFVDVDPQVATVAPPKNAKYYSNRNSQAANPDADKEADIPKIDGKQTEVTKTEDVPRANFDKLQPTFRQPSKEQEPERARPAQPPGDLAMVKPDLQLRQDTGTNEHVRPRTIKEALMSQHRNQLVGERMKQEGGVRNRLQMSSLDAKATPFGDYDAAFIEAVQDRWYSLLDNMSFDGYRRGKVVIQFHLTYDGRITDMKLVESGVGNGLEVLCEKAVYDPAPYERWPRDMRLMVDKDYREIQFTFFYD